MELDSVLKLINAVSDSSLTSFTLDDGNTKLSFAADRAEVIKNNEFSIVRNTKEEQNSSYEHQDRKERRVGKECRSRWSPYH